MITTCIVQYAENFGIQNFFEVSAKTGHNVQEAFESFFREVHQKVTREREGEISK